MDTDAMAAKFTRIRKLAIKTRPKQGEERAQLLEQILANLDEFYAEYGNPFDTGEGRSPRSRPLSPDAANERPDHIKILAKIQHIDRSLGLLARQPLTGGLFEAKSRLMNEREKLSRQLI